MVDSVQTTGGVADTSGTPPISNPISPPISNDTTSSAHDRGAAGGVADMMVATAGVTSVTGVGATGVLEVSSPGGLPPVGVLVLHACDGSPGCSSPLLIFIGVFLSRKRLSKSHIGKSYEHIESSIFIKKLQKMKTLFCYMEKLDII